jgi:hypothetical protein
MRDPQEAERIRKLQELCESLDELKKQAEEMRKTAAEELQRARRSGFAERRAVSRQEKSGRG